MTPPASVLSSEQRVMRKHDTIESGLDDAIFVLDTATGNCFSFSGPSKTLWELLSAPTTADEAALRLFAVYEIDQLECRAEVLAHFCNLQDEGLITLVAG
ncbi:PqqD family peptide modification chaperone [Sphingomonas psychrolutea]|uniref:PqqD family protein n=1 Tax=Sphingomonas psychrolutea TaxID=1259676 RepID=A0ABQ1H780_9SPHN|nr:PqqD family peptide modification chaperone [Sphingomonas psychrolutea]GGA61982.1 hypothetical protein GCM10011395_35360 [Sphingomonas psychrolutea]